MAEMDQEQILTDRFLDDWPASEHSIKAIRRAGELLASESLDLQQLEHAIARLQEQIDSAELSTADLKPAAMRYQRWLEAYKVLTDWRSAHMYPLTIFHSKMTFCVGQIESEAVIALRLKRLPSIVAKLRRFEHMSLARMQDLGGCRAVVRDVPAAYGLMQDFMDQSDDHELVDVTDYITAPKEDGYRCIHLVYRFVGVGKVASYSGVRVEIQIRTKIQHAWATAVETVDLFQRQAIKAGRGDPRWRRFFLLASDAFALGEVQPPARTNVIPQPLRAELEDLTTDLGVFERLEHYSKAVHRVVQESVLTTFLLKLDLINEELNVVGYGDGEHEKAQADYAAAERAMGPDYDVVLVSVESTRGLREAYPNYFADTNLFLDELRQALGWVSHDPVPEWVFSELGKTATE